MRIATVLFTYCRSEHAKQVLDALALNYELPEKLFIFQDGRKNGGDDKEWQKVNELIHDVGFCPVEQVVSGENLGVKKSVIQGVDRVLGDYDAVIVLEDDCVPTKNFIGFMRQALERYAENEKVYSVTGYGFSDKLRKNICDAYFVGRISSWGWGTWRDRWNQFEPKEENLQELMSDREISRNLAIWGNDLSQMYKAGMRGKNDSWAVHWALHVIKKKGYCLTPYQSLIKNIGMDGSGIHSSKTDKFDVKTENEEKKEFIFPDITDFNMEAADWFLDNFGGYTAFNSDETKPPVMIYGLGNYYRKNDKFFCDRYYIKGFIDKVKKGFYGGKEIISLKDVKNYPDCQIFIMLMGIEESREIEDMLHNDYGIERERIRSAFGYLKYMDGKKEE